MTLLVIDGEPIMLSVRIGNADFDLGEYATVKEAAVAAGKWVRDRGLEFAPDTYNRLADAYHREAAVVIFDVVPGESPERKRQRAQAWHQADYYPYIHVAHRMSL
jgi:hypothetical protein